MPGLTVQGPGQRQPMEPRLTVKEAHPLGARPTVSHTHLEPAGTLAEWEGDWQGLLPALPLLGSTSISQKGAFTCVWCLDLCSCHPGDIS